MALLGALRAQKTKNQKPKTKNQKPKTKNQKPKTKKFSGHRPPKNDSGCCGFSRPIRASPPLKKDDSHARRDAGQGSWYRMYLTIRGRQRIFSARISWNAGQRGSQGDTSPCIVRGRSPQKAVTQWQLNQPGRAGTQYVSRQKCRSHLKTITIAARCKWYSSCPTSPLQI